MDQYIDRYYGCKLNKPTRVSCVQDPNSFSKQTQNQNKFTAAHLYNILTQKVTKFSDIAKHDKREIAA